MLQNKKKYKAIFLVLLPLLIGYFINKLLGLGYRRDNEAYSIIGGFLLSMWMYGSAIAFWFYTGWTFGKFNMSVLKKFILGNLLWMILIGVEVWQSILVGNENLNINLSFLSQYYPLGFMGVATTIVGLFTNSFHGTTIIFISYFVMLAVFILGFVFGIRSKYREIQTNGN